MIYMSRNFDKRTNPSMLLEGAGLAYWFKRGSWKLKTV